jgi:hypothetical protein
MSDRKALARAIAALPSHALLIFRASGAPKVRFTEEEILAVRGGRTAEEYRRYLIRSWGEE